MVILTFYGGVSEIGGNKILLIDGDTGIFLDFGQSFNFGTSFFTGWLAPRKINGLRDYFEFDLLPRLKGLYSLEQLKTTDLPYTKPRIDAVFLSHAHFDHINHIEFLDSEIPVYLGEGTKLFLEAMEETSSFCDYGKHRFQTFRTGDRITIQDIVVEPIHVDHSIPAAYGFLIHTSEGTIAYTGDLRAHGPRKDMTQQFIEKARASEPVAMICEGTRVVEFEKRRNYSEGQVLELSNEIASSTKKIVFATHYSRDMDRLRTFYTTAKNNDRKMVVSPKTAHLLGRLVEDTRLDLPNPIKDENVQVYYKRKKTGEFDEKDYFVWEREFLDKKATYKSIQENQGKLIMDLDFYQFGELIDINPHPGSHFIHSMSEPFSEEDIEDQVMHNWLDHFQMQFHQLHASGHMNKSQILNMINYIKPERVFPIHTENQDLFEAAGSTVQAIAYGKEYMLH
jgi:ribonuclease J